MAKRQLTQAAQVAKIIRAKLRENGIAATVRSENFSMGNSVCVTLTGDPLPATVARVKQYCGQFQYGHFDGMTDMYENSNLRNDIPQTKFMTVTVDYSPNIKQQAYDFARRYYADLEDAPKRYTDAGNFRAPRVGEFAQNTVYRILGGSIDCGFWASRKPRQPAA